MNVDSWKEELEKQHYKSLDVLFDEMELTDSERNVFFKYKRCHYWLLRSMPFSNRFGEINPLKQLAVLMLNLHSKRVSGSINDYIKRMFPRRGAYFVKSVKNGYRFSFIHHDLEHLSFELKIMSFLLERGFEIFLCEGPGVKPEFEVVKGACRFFVEAKKMDTEAVLDNIFGDSFVEVKPKRRTKEDLDKGYRRIKKTLEKIYEEAKRKLKGLDETDQLLLIIDPSYSFKRMGPYAKQYLESLPNKWVKEQETQILGVIIDDSRVHDLINPYFKDSFWTGDLLNNFKMFSSYTPKEVEDVCLD